MLVVPEIVLPYPPALYEAWKAGDKSLIPGWVDVPAIVSNQPSYHFGEYFVLRHYADLGWRGYVHFAIGTWEPSIEKYRSGREKVEDVFGPERLGRIRAVSSEVRDGKGEPDVFLYKDTGETLFLEVKKGSDRVAPAQLECLAQIHAVLGADVGVVYLREEGRVRRPKSYALPVEKYLVEG